MVLSQNSYQMQTNVTFFDLPHTSFTALFLLLLSLITLSSSIYASEFDINKKFATLPLSDKEKNYWQESTLYRQQKIKEYQLSEEGIISTPEQLKAEQDALHKLEVAIREIIGPVSIRGIEQRGEITLKEMDMLDMAMLDGLKYKTPQFGLIVTTLPILRVFLKEVARLPVELASLPRNTELYSPIWFSETMTYRFAEIPVARQADQSLAYAFIGVFTSENPGDYIPDELFTFVVKGNRLFLTHSSLNNTVKDIPPCQKMWENYIHRDQKSHETFLFYNATVEKKLTYEQYLKSNPFIFEWLSNAYLRCANREIPKQPYYPTLQKMAQSIVDQL